MKNIVTTASDIIENLRELARSDPTLRYTLKKLAQQNAGNRKRVLDALKPGKSGSPNKQATRNAFFAEIERTIQICRPQVEEEQGRKVSERKIIEWLIKKGNFTTDEPISKMKAGVRVFTPSAEKAIKRIQDGLARYRRSRKMCKTQ